MDWREEQIIKASWLDEYKRIRHIIHVELHWWDRYLYYLRKLEAFPFDLLVNPHNLIFWKTVQHAYLQNIIMIAWRVAIEDKKDRITLKNFKKDIIENTIDDKVRTYVLNELNKLDFDQKSGKLRRKVNLIRNHYVGHLVQSEILTPVLKDTETEINLEDLAQLLQLTHELFNTLCFGNYHELRLSEHHSSQYFASTDIDYLLEIVAKNSPTINAPENDRLFWEQRLLPKLSDSDLETINTYRANFQLNRVDRP